MSGGRRAYDRSDSALSRRGCGYRGLPAWVGEMSDTGKTREERLAEALRENLRKRKAQAREQAKPTPKT